MQWCKWIGLILIALAVSSIGFWLAYRMEKRLGEYRQLERLFTLLASRMRIGEDFLAAIGSCIEAGSGALTPWLRRMEKRLQNREPLSDIWPQEVERAKGELHLEKEDYRVLAGLGRSMQGASLESCLGQLSQTQDYFHAQQVMLEQVIQEQGRMYRTISILAGILVLVVLV